MPGPGILDILSNAQPVPREPGYVYGGLLPFRKPVGGGPAEWSPTYSDAVAGLLDMVTSPMRSWRGQQMDPRDAMNVGLGLLGTNAAVSPLVKSGGPGTVGIFAGAGAKTADLAKLKRAQEMSSSGATEDAIWQATGWFKGPEGKWKFEIPDDALQVRNMEMPFFSNELAKKATGKSITELPMDARSPFVKEGNRLMEEYWKNPDAFLSPLGDYVQHPALLAAYPELGKLRVGQMSGAYLGGYSPSDKTLRYGGGILGMKNVPQRSVVAHELNHAVEDIEGFAKGGNTLMAFQNKEAWDILKRIRKELRTPSTVEQYAKSAWQSDVVTPEILADYKKNYLPSIRKAAKDYDAAAQSTAAEEYYKRLAGEAAARATQKRLDMTPEELATTHPRKSYDVPWDRLIIK